jgi:hypothetical protein
MIQEIWGGTILKGVADVYPRKIRPRKIPMRVKKANEILGTTLEPKTISSLLKKLQIQCDKLALNKKNSDELLFYVPTYRPDIEREIDLIEKSNKVDTAIIEKMMDFVRTYADRGYNGKGDFAMAPDGRLSRRGERQVVPFAFAGVSLCNASLFDDSPEGPFSLNLLWDRALKRGRLYGLRLDGHWMHVGTPDALAEAETWFESEGA